MKQFHTPLLIGLLEGTRQSLVQGGLRIPKPKRERLSKYRIMDKRSQWLRGGNPLQWSHTQQQ